MAPADGGEHESDPGSHRPPPHPLDRVWVHPSELPPVTPARPSLLSKVVATVSGLAIGAGLVAMTVAVATSGSGSSRQGNGFVADSQLSTAIVLVTVTHALGSSLGSGISLGGGQVVTSGQLVAPGETVEVTDADGNRHDATVVGHDEVYDVALLDVDADLPAAALGRADLVTDDARLMAIAATAPAHHWIGLTEINDRDVVARSQLSGELFTGLLATDLPSTLAHAGGALVSGDGRVVAILTTPPGTDMTGAAIPIERVTGVCDQIRRKGSAQHGWFGVLAQDSMDGARVHEVSEDGPAERAGLRVGDIVIGVHGKPVTDAGTLVSSVRERRPGDEVEIRYLRDGRERVVTVTLGTLEPQALATS